MQREGEAVATCTKHGVSATCIGHQHGLGKVTCYAALGFGFLGVKAFTLVLLLQLSEPERHPGGALPRGHDAQAEDAGARRGGGGGGG